MEVVCVSLKISLTTRQFTSQYGPVYIYLKNCDKLSHIIICLFGKPLSNITKKKLTFIFICLIQIDVFIGKYLDVASDFHVL